MADTPAAGAPSEEPIVNAQQVGPETNAVVAELPPVEEKAAEEDALPEGFDSWEAYGKAQAKAAKETPAKEEPAADALAPELKAEIDKLPEDRREAATPFFKEFSETGTLTDESKQAAAAAFGVTPEMVDLYMAGARTSQETALTPLYDAAGGKETYQEFVQWAQTGLTAEEQAEFDAELDKGPEAAKAMITKATDLWKEQGGGKPPRDVTRNQPLKGSEAATDVYESSEQMRADMASPKYAKDPVFRDAVAKKLGRSNV